MSDNRNMEKIDADWLKERLAGERGKKARLAEKLGVGSDVVTKMTSGVRQIRQDEVPVILEFFGLHVEALTVEELRWLEAYRNAAPERLAAAETLLGYQSPPLEKP